ncbi:carbohydrate ABC transporter permease [Ruminiclostridium cellobioparum]|uniref:ABC-type sugar transport system, permease component n=1 Tax=Ruminiclostridium cellobioparum subsp. termitidis CT1112 TaxID=1195236 RepID=S0FHN4_RUMCE|nr:carbohydrate ABC transporter permease [Ruminiclostridium cellobioparum]EMS69436.1 ABC-type sugar transport system, permease component [Ruminiclostridium cellobioparum subsp. termitidis CT1112]
MKASREEKIFYAFCYILLTLAALSCLIPLLNLFSISVSSADAVVSGKVSILPVEWSLESYKTLFKISPILGAFKNSLLLTVAGVILNLVFSILTAYPLSRPYFKGRAFFSKFIVFTMLISGGILPNFILMKSLGLINSYGSVWLITLISTYNVLIMKTFFQNIPIELSEAAYVDGCGEFRLMLQIILPLSKALLATMTLFYMVANWNEFLNTLMFIADPKKYTMTVVVQEMIRNSTMLTDAAFLDPETAKNMTGDGIQAAGIFVMMLPMLCVYPFLQRFFIKGVMLGSIKG